VVLAKPAPTVRELTDMGHDVRAAVARADALIEALLTLARNDRGLSVREPVDVATVAEDALDGTDVGDLRLRTSLRPAVTQGDAVLLLRLVANLVDNAIRYNVSGGEVSVATSTVDGQARIEVTNTGPVVEPGAVPGLFEPFRRLHERTGGDGVGLGLAIVASVVGVHAGTVRAAALPGGGLAVVATLPAPTGYHRGAPYALASPPAGDNRVGTP
jgi:signal transduction histidine kinase